MNEMDSCPVCESTKIQARWIASAIPMREDGLLHDRSHADSGVLFDCPKCGRFVATHMDDVNLRSPRLRNNEFNPAHLSALLREQSLRGLPVTWLRYGMDPYGPLEMVDVAPVDLDELMRHWPSTVPERINRALCNLARSSPVGGHKVKLDVLSTSLLFATTWDEAAYHLEALVQQGLLRNVFDLQVVAVTPSGWARFEELTSGMSNRENPVFVAMWFGGEEEKTAMDEAFEQGIQPAIERAGYKATRVDLVEHNEWIMDKVMGDIRLAPFVVADFTSNRNGVYFEAGFARGLGIPVIHTCRGEDFKEAHFDTQQLNHVIWKTPEQLGERLHNRIMGTIGPGPYRRS